MGRIGTCASIRMTASPMCCQSSGFNSVYLWWPQGSRLSGKQGEVCTYLPIWSELEFVVVRVIAEWSTELGHHVVDGTDVHLSLGIRVCAIVKFLWSWVVNVSPHLAPGYTAGVPVVVCPGVCNHEVPRVTSSSTSSGSVLQTMSNISGQAGSSS